jgi:uncharacterized protein (UPF0335 family)
MTAVFPSLEPRADLADRRKQPGGLSGGERTEYHSYAYGFRRAVLGNFAATSPIDANGAWFRPNLTTEAEAMYRRKFARARGGRQQQASRWFARHFGASIMAENLSSEIPDKFGGAVDHEALGRYVERIERLHDERDEITSGMKVVYEEAKIAGFVPKLIRQIVSERRMKEDDRHISYALLAEYRAALGMLADLPLGEAALAAAEAPPRPKPRAFADTPIHPPRRGRPRKNGGSVLFQ